MAPPFPPRWWSGRPWDNDARTCPDRTIPSSPRAARVQPLVSCGPGGQACGKPQLARQQPERSTGASRCFAKIAWVAGRPGRLPRSEPAKSRTPWPGCRLRSPTDAGITSALYTPRRVSPVAARDERRRGAASAVSIPPPHIRPPGRRARGRLVCAAWRGGPQSPVEDGRGSQWVRVRRAGGARALSDLGGAGTGRAVRLRRSRAGGRLAHGPLPGRQGDQSE